MDLLNLGGDDSKDALEAVGRLALESGEVSKEDAKKMKKAMGKKDPGDFLNEYLFGGKKEPYNFLKPSKPSPLLDQEQAILPSLALPEEPQAAAQPAPPMTPPPAPLPETPQELVQTAQAGPLPLPKGTILKENQVEQTGNTQKSTNNVYKKETLDDIFNFLRAQPEYKEQGQGVKDLEAQMNMLQGLKDAPQSSWIKPLLAYADSMKGTNMAGQYNDQAAPNRMDMLLKYQDELQKRKSDMTKTLLESATKLKTGTDTNEQMRKLLEGSALQQGEKPQNEFSQARVGRMISESGAAFDKDTLMKEYTRTKNNLDRAQSMMEGKTPITGKNFALLQQDMINAMAPGGAATEGKVNREMVETFYAQINDVMQKFGNIKDLRKEQPEIFAQLKGLLDQVYDDYKSAALERVDDIGSNYTWVPNEDVQKTVQGKMKALKERWNKPRGGGGGGGHMPSLSTPSAPSVGTPSTGAPAIGQAPSVGLPLKKNYHQMTDAELDEELKQRGGG